MITLRIRNEAPGVWRLSWNAGEDPHGTADLLVVDARVAEASWRAVADVLVYGHDGHSRIPA